MTAGNNHIGLLLTNLGSADSTDVADVKKFLTDFLMDKRVMDMPYLFRSILVKGIVVPRRAAHAADLYRKIWTKEGSPIIVEAKRLKNKVQSLANFPVALSMRYGKPSTEAAFASLLQQNPELKTVIVLPLYPQYTMSSFDTAVVEVKHVYGKGHYPFQIKFLNPFFDHPDYIAALSEKIKPFTEKDYDKILFSYHGIPERHLDKDNKRIQTGTCDDFDLPKIDYQKQALETSRLVAERLNIPKEKYETSFQSKLSAAGTEWIKPYTADRLAALPGEGVKKLLVASPAFINDCLETIEEIGMEGKETFEQAGGESLTLIPCLNDDEQFAQTVVRWAIQKQ